MTQLFFFRALSLLLLLSNASTSIFSQGLGQSPKPPAEPPPLERLRPTFFDRKITEAQKKVLFPSPEDQAAFAIFLKQNNTGLFRILPKGKYEFGRIISADQGPDTILPLLGGGSYYSFTERTNKFGPWSEIRLVDNRLSSGVVTGSIGLFTCLGDISLDSTTTQTPGVSFLAELVPPTKYSGLVNLRSESENGIQAGPFSYSSAIEASPGTTYALRSVVYSKDGYLVYPNQPYTRLNISRIGYEGSDILIAFRIIRQNQDGSLDILWKRLQKFPSQAIKRQSVREIKQLIEQRISKGTPAIEVTVFLDLNGFSHSNFLDGTQNDPHAVTGTTGVIYATIPEIERRQRTVTDLVVYFYFNDKKEFIGYSVKKIGKWT
jgi:hypothetical protein